MPWRRGWVGGGNTGGNLMDSFIYSVYYRRETWTRVRYYLSEQKTMDVMSSRQASVPSLEVNVLLSLSYAVIRITNYICLAV